MPPFYLLLNEASTLDFGDIHFEVEDDDAIFPSLEVQCLWWMSIFQLYDDVVLELVMLVIEY